MKDIEGKDTGGKKAIPFSTENIRKCILKSKKGKPNETKQEKENFS